MARVLAIANQKGGVAKTTTTVNLAAALAERGHRVLAVDLDPQGGLTFSMGVDPDNLDETINDVVVRRLPLDKIVATRPIGRRSYDSAGEDQGNDVDLAPANIDLAGAEAVLLAKTGREYALERALREIKGGYDYILIDCPPSLGILTINGLTAAEEVLIPLQCEALSHRGVGQLLETLMDIRHFTNPALEIRGIIPTMYDGRSRHARAVLGDVGERYSIAVLEPPVKKSIRFAEAAQAGVSILAYAPMHPGADSYRRHAAQLEEDSP
jgi:chromosome partitioning protein